MRDPCWCPTPEISHDQASRMRSSECMQFAYIRIRPFTCSFFYTVQLASYDSSCVNQPSTACYKLLSPSYFGQFSPTHGSHPSCLQAQEFFCYFPYCYCFMSVGHGNYVVSWHDFALGTRIYHTSSPQPFFLYGAPRSKALVSKPQEWYPCQIVIMRQST